MQQRCLGCMEEFGAEYNICPHCGYVVGTPAEEAIHMEPGTLLYDRYIIGKVLGYGGFGVTYIGWDGKLEQKVAIKEYLPGEFSTRMPGQSCITVLNGEKSEQFHSGKDKFLDEAKRLAKFKNESGIVKIFDSFEENGTAYIAMEYLDGETLATYLKREKTIPEDMAVDMLMPIMQSLQVVHSEGILHRDIAPDNIFITTRGEIKLIDFGASRYATTSHSRSLTVIIKPGYSPEEQYRSRGDQGPYTDVYAIAATLYKMITGKTPADAMERRVKYENQNKDILEDIHKLNKDVSVNRENAIMNALNVRIEDRTPDVAAFISELQADPPVKRRYGKIKKLDFYRWPVWLKVSIPTAIVACLTFGILMLTGVIKFTKFSENIVIPDNTVVTPYVEGMKIKEAVDLIENNKLIAVTEGTIESPYIPAGEVVLQSPLGGSYLKNNEMVYITVSSGEGATKPVNGISTVPYVVADPLETAQAKLDTAGLKGIVIEEYSDYTPKGHIVNQSQEPGDTLAEGESITITVSLGSKPFAMINVLEMPVDEAMVALEDLGLSVELTIVKDDKIPENHVVTQSVAEGELVQRGDKITLAYSGGVNAYEVPNIVGKLQADAEKALKDIGFKVRVNTAHSDTVEAGKVISQTPGAGTSQPYGSEITITVSEGKASATLTLIPNGGKLAENEKTLTIYNLTPYGTLPTPTRTGYEFLGWFTKEEGGEQITADRVDEKVINAKIYAQWKAKSYTVTFNANDGSVDTKSITVKFDSEYGSLPTPTKNGYGFAGWCDENGNRVRRSDIHNTAKNITLYAKWDANAITVVLDPNGDNVSLSNGSITVTYNGTYGDLPTPSRVGYSFNGWYTAKTGGSRITSSNKVESNNTITLYAQWIANSYKITFDPNGGSVGTASMKVKYGSAYSGLPTPKLAGKTFAGWYTDDNQRIVDGNIHNIAGDITVTAYWSTNSYTLYFDANGGSVGESSRSVPYGSAYGTLPTPTRDYYTFAGWYTSANGGSQVYDSTKMGNSNVTIYAQWTQNTISDWVLESDVPSGAEILEEKWTYTLREYNESSSSSLSGWTKYDTQRTSWSSWSSWSTTNPTNGTRNVESRSVEDHTEYHYYRWTNGYGTYTYSKDSSYELQEKWFTYILPTSQYGTSIGYVGSDTPANIWVRVDYSGNWSTDKTFTKIVYRTEWRYQDPIYTYYYYRDVSKESTSDPTGKSNVSNIQRYVKYRPK